MSYREAQEDGVLTKAHGINMAYYPPCHICGQPTYSRNYVRGYRYTCKDCKAAAAIRKIVNKTA